MAVAAGAVAVPRPNKAAQVLYAQARPILRAVLQIPTYIEKVSAVLEITLENFYSAARTKYGEFTAGAAARERLDRSGGDKLRDLLRRDAQYLRYKRSVHGGKVPFEMKLGAGVDKSPTRQQRSAAGGAATAVRKVVGGRLAVGLGLGAGVGAGGAGGDSLGGSSAGARSGGVGVGGVGGAGATSAEEEADDVFESEFVLLREFWQFDANPFPLTRKALLTLRHQQAVASLAFSCDWVAHRVLRMCVALSMDSATGAGGTAPGGAVASVSGSVATATGVTAAAVAAAAAGITGGGAGAAKSSPAQRGWGKPLPPTPDEQRGGGAATPAARLQEIARKMSALADDCLLVLRLELMVTVSVHMQQLSGIDLDVDRGKASTTAMSLGRIEDACVVEMNRGLRDMQEAISPIEPKAHLGLLAPRELFAYVASPLPRLLPRLFVHSVRYYGSGRLVTVGGVGKLNKILSTLQQTVVDVTETSRAYLQPGGGGGSGGSGGGDGGGSTGGSSLVDVIAERFARASRYVALMSMTQEDLEAYIRANRTEYAKEEYRVQWILAGPNRRVGPEGGAHFDTWWAY
ncbi:unnamed protein product [Phaeothamnion confervicola]